MIALCTVFKRIEMYVVILNIGKAKCQRTRVRRCRKPSGRGLSSGARWDIAAESRQSRPPNKSLPYKLSFYWRNTSEHNVVIVIFAVDLNNSIKITISMASL